VDPRAVLDVVVKRKIPSPLRESNPRTPIVQPVAQRYTNYIFLGMSFNSARYLDLCNISASSNLNISVMKLLYKIT
jgi:hypothetical protein